MYPTEISLVLILQIFRITGQLASWRWNESLIKEFRVFKWENNLPKDNKVYVNLICSSVSSLCTVGVWVSVGS
jgi:hypothetical protein